MIVVYTAAVKSTVRDNSRKYGVRVEASIQLRSDTKSASKSTICMVGSYLLSTVVFRQKVTQYIHLISKEMDIFIIYFNAGCSN